jgi:ABC-type branched-subunit amino acid transport system substrate-binding protein
MRKLLACALFLTLAPVAWAQDIVIGQSVPLSGSNADIGRDMRDGALAIFNKVNASNQLGGRKIQLVTLDNANNRQRAAENTQQLVNQGALALFGYNSATNSVDALPLMAQNNMLFLAPFSGSLSLRNHPNVYTIRASYKDETLEILESKRAVGSNKAVVVYYDDEVGRSNYEAVASTFADQGMERPRGVAVKRGGAAVNAAVVDAIAKDNPHYVLATTQFNVVGEFLKIANDKGVPIPVAALSFVNPDELVASVGDLARGTVVAQVMPSPRSANQISVPLMKECAEALNTLNGARLNYTTLESCIAAKVLVEAIKKAGPQVTRASLLQAMGNLGRLDLKGFSLNFSNGQRHGSNWVELTILSRGNRFVQ